MKSRKLLSAVVSWWRSAAGAVKHAAAEPGFRPKGWRQLFEGWQAAALLVAIVAVAALLVIPRPVIPSELPLPSVDRGEQRRAVALDLERTRRAAEDPLPYEVRAVGEALRRHGLAELTAGSDLAGGLRELRRAAARVAPRGVESLLTLCALQTRLFLEALASWEQSGSRHPDLDELGGAFLRSAERQGWLGAERRLRLTELERRALFRMRWLELTGLRRLRGFKPSLNEWRAYYRVLLERAPPTNATLEVVQALAKLDPAYPAQLARGIVLARVGDGRGAAPALRAHLAGPQGAFWRLRARNALAAAVQY